MNDFFWMTDEGVKREGILIAMDAHTAIVQLENGTKTIVRPQQEIKGRVA